MQISLYSTYLSVYSAGSPVCISAHSGASERKKGLLKFLSAGLGFPLRTQGLIQSPHSITRSLSSECNLHLLRSLIIHSLVADYSAYRGYKHYEGRTHNCNGDKLFYPLNAGWDCRSQRDCPEISELFHFFFPK